MTSTEHNELATGSLLPISGEYHLMSIFYHHVVFKDVPGGEPEEIVHYAGSTDDIERWRRIFALAIVNAREALRARNAIRNEAGEWIDADTHETDAQIRERFATEVVGEDGNLLELDQLLEHPIMKNTHSRNLVVSIANGFSNKAMLCERQYP